MYIYLPISSSRFLVFEIGHNGSAKGTRSGRGRVSNVRCLFFVCLWSLGASSVYIGFFRGDSRRGEELRGEREREREKE